MGHYSNILRLTVTMMKTVSILILSIFAVRGGQGARCNLIPALEESTGSDVGFIQIPGELYTPLAMEIQKQMADRARVWVGITKSWLGNFPNPLEIAGALNDCMSQAAGENLGGPIYIAGH